MVQLVTYDDRLYFRKQIAAMHHDRKRVFIDRMGWDLPVVDGQYEIDQFDTDDAVYLLDLDQSGRVHLGSIRLLPTTKPHILGSLFPQLCQTAVPTGEDVWEITRLCMTPGLQRGESRKIRDRLGAAAIEFGLLYGINRYTMVAAKTWFSQFHEMGWHCDRLGPLQDVNGEVLGALVAYVTPLSLQALRRKSGVGNLLLKNGYYAEAA
jgi:N-acyl-L-homoserine lactone synthetase